MIDRECGCEMGSAMAIVAVSVYAVSVTLGIGDVVGDARVTAVVGVLVFVLGAVAGKRVAIARARRERAALLLELERRVGR